MSTVLRFDGQSYTPEGAGQELTQGYAAKVIRWNGERANVHYERAVGGHPLSSDGQARAFVAAAKHAGRDSYEMFGVRVDECVDFLLELVAD